MPDNPSETQNPTRKLGAGAGPMLHFASIVAVVSALWLIVSSALGHMGRPWPCAILGVAILAGVTFAYRVPARRVSWGLLVIIAGIFAMLIGQGAVLPGLIAVVAGALIVMVGAEFISGRPE